MSAQTQMQALGGVSVRVTKGTKFKGLWFCLGAAAVVLSTNEWLRIIFLVGLGFQLGRFAAGWIYRRTHQLATLASGLTFAGLLAAADLNSRSQTFEDLRNPILLGAGLAFVLGVIILWVLTIRADLKKKEV